MNSVIADFVGLLGPGQIVDRHALVAVPAGFLKVIICNTIQDLHLIVTEFKENLNDTTLGIKILVKAHLCIGNDVIDSTPLNQKPVIGLERNVQVLKFDKSLQNRKETIEERDDKAAAAEEILQICVYASKKGSRTKQLIGLVHISLDDIALDDPHTSSVDAWYKVFPSSSFVAGYPIIKGNLHHINSASESTTPSSPVSTDIISWMSSSPSVKSDLPSSSASDCASERPVKRNSFRSVAKTLVRFLQIRKNGSGSNINSAKNKTDSDQASTSGLDKNSLNDSFTFSSNNNLSKRPKNGTIFPQNELRKEIRNGLKNRPSSTFLPKRATMESLMKLKFRRSYYEKTTDNKPRFRRCEEVICSSSVEAPSFWAGDATTDSNFYLDHVSTSTINQSRFGGLGLKTLSLNRKPNSVGSESIDLSSTETEELNPYQQNTKQTAAVTVKVAATVYSWARKVQKKAKFQTLPPPLSPRSDEDFVFPEHDNVYDILKSLQTMSQSSSGGKKACEATAHCLDRDDVIESTESLNLSVKAENDPEIAPGGTPSSVDPNDCFETASECSCNTIECRLRRKKFANNRSLALTDRDKLQNSLLFSPSRRLSMSDDDYVTCSEQQSSTNLSIVSSYTTASEKR